MSKFMLLFVGKEYKPSNDEETKEHMKKWESWIGQLVSTGKFESGLPFEWGGREVSKDNVGMYNSPEVDIGGYMVINADSIEEACELAKNAPNVELGGTVVVRTCMGM